MRRTVVATAALALLVIATAGCESFHPFRTIGRGASVMFTDAQMDEMPLKGIKVGICADLPLPAGFPSTSAGCLMPLRAVA